MLTTKVLSYYNHLFATTVLYFTIVDPIQDMTNSLNQELQSSDQPEHQRRLPSLVYAVDVSANQDHYQVLGLEKDATKQDIHRAFRKLAKKYHPDKNKDKGAQDEFIKIFKAYETLSDEKKREEYDKSRRSTGHGSYSSWNTAGSMNDFDINEFYRQYESQFMRHAEMHMHNHQHYHNQQHNQHHNQHHNQNHDQAHEQFSFHGVNLENLFHDIDEDEFISFSKLFNHVGPDRINHNHNHEHSDGFDGTLGDGASYFGSFVPNHIHDQLHHIHQHSQNLRSSNGAQASYSCQTIKRQVNGIIMTQTSCT